MSGSDPRLLFRPYSFVLFFFIIAVSFLFTLSFYALEFAWKFHVLFIHILSIVSLLISPLLSCLYVFFNFLKNFFSFLQPFLFHYFYTYWRFDFRHFFCVNFHEPIMFFIFSPVSARISPKFPVLCFRNFILILLSPVFVFLLHFLLSIHSVSSSRL